MIRKSSHFTLFFNIIFILALLAWGMGAAPRPVRSASTLAWNTFLGGSGLETGYIGIAQDGNGNIYIMGESGASWGNPVRAFTAGADIFVAKLNPSGALVWNTFLGGDAWDCCGGAIAVDGSGNVYVIARSDAAWGTPLRAYTANTDAVVAKLNPFGALLWHTFLGGNEYDWGDGLSLDGSGNVLLTGGSQATWGNPVRAHASVGVNDAFAAKLNPNGGLIWNTFLGQSGNDWGTNNAVDSSGNLYLTGGSDATWGAPVRAFSGGINDAFAIKISPTGALLWHTFLGGTDMDWGGGIAVDDNGSVFVSGGSDSTWGAPRQNYVGAGDAFAVKLDSTGSMLWNTFLGGSAEDWALDVDLDGGGNVYVSGGSHGTWGHPALPYTGGNDAFTAKLDPSGYLGMNFFLGGSTNDQFTSVLVSSTGEVIGAGFSQGTWGNPVRAYTGGEDAFVARINLAPTFSDVPNGYWAWSWIERLYKAGVTTGCGTAPLAYCPEEQVSRAQMAIFLERGMRGAAYTPPPGTGLFFGDVPLGHWAVNWIERLAADGITTGCGGGNYCPGDSVSRAQMAIFLLRARYGAAYTPPPATGIFADVPTSHWAAAWIEQLYAQKITSGCSQAPLSYCPDALVTRAQMAVFLMKALVVFLK